MVNKALLRVNVFDSSEGMPLPDAKVEVFDQDEKTGEMISDISGNTPEFELETVNGGLSETPDENGIRPYSTYKLKVSREGFSDYVADGIQMFGGQNSYQNVIMTRTPENNGEKRVFPHTLWSDPAPKGQEEVVKPLPPGLGFVVLPDPVVPEFVTVHDGAPSDASAANYRVPFADYIKNVACCEIYPTWPAAALEANIMAIVSFTLNRVYTEWYVSRGYDFTITSSTSFDQAFSYGRNIFDSIGKTVDYLFTTFITRPNIRQPLLAQYCNGSTVSCPGWLSQWGSKKLADQGLDAVTILRTYYGSDVYLLEGTKVEGIPYSFPGAPIQTGTVGNGVRTVQEQLNAISVNYPAIPRLAVDGIFGRETRRAVTEFQRIFGYEETGIVDFGTWYGISRIYVAVARLAV